MSSPIPSPTRNIRSSVPAKSFLIGEYAVLAGFPGIIANLDFRFSLGPTFPGCERFRPNPDSPAGKFLEANPSLRSWAESLSFSDPLVGKGGFGGSTAQFLCLQALVYQHSPLSAAELLKTYLSVASNEGIQPSGADLLGQFAGDLAWVEPSRAGFEHLAVPSPLIYFFSAAHQSGRKTPTHEHLKELVQRDFPTRHTLFLASLNQLVVEARLKIEKSDVAGLGQTLDRYANLLWQEGLEAESAHADRVALRGLPGVIGAKGAGALLTDAVIVLLDSLEAESGLLRTAEARDLRLVSKGLKNAKGLTIEKLA